MQHDNKFKVIKIILTISLIIYLIYFMFVIFWIKNFHSQISPYSIVGIFLPCILSLLFLYGLFKTSIRNKKYIYTSLILILFPILISIGILGLNEYESKFNRERWIEKQDKRVWMVDDLLGRHKIVGMNKDKIIELLGEPSDTEYFKEMNNIVYWLGPERGLISIDSEWLVIWFDRKDIAVELKIMRD